MIRKKVGALCPEIRDEVCDHRHVYYQGQIPCTGDLTCSMCGMKFASKEHVERERKEAEVWIDTNGKKV